MIVFLALSVPDTVIIGLVGSVLATLCAVISHMWRRMARDHDLMLKRSEDCEKKHDEAVNRLNRVEGRLGIFESCPRKSCPFRPRHGATDEGAEAA